MSKKLTLEEFTKKATEVHGDAYDYSKVNYINGMTKITIICKTHGNFVQLPMKHLAGNGCKACYVNTISSSTRKFVEKAKEVHNDKYCYDKVEYINNKTKVIITCPEHGDFAQIPQEHLRGHNCKECIRDKFTMPIEQFIEKAKEVHNDKYCYDKVMYTNAKTKVDIICKTHGIFKQVPNSHLSGNGCPICANINNKRKYFNVPTILYFITISNGINKAYKLGITKRTLQKRYSRDIVKGINILPILTYKFASGKQAYLFEQYILSKYKNELYSGTDILIYGGNSEVFNSDISNVLIKELKEINENIMFK